MLAKQNLLKADDLKPKVTTIISENQSIKTLIEQSKLHLNSSDLEGKVQQIVDGKGFLKAADLDAKVQVIVNGMNIDGKVVKILDEKKFLRVMDFDENFRTMVTKEKVFKTAEFKPALDKILQEYDYKGQWEEYCKV